MGDRRAKDDAMALEQLVARERDERSSEMAEVRATLDSMWKWFLTKEQPRRPSGERQFLKFEEDGEEDRYKEFVGDREDIRTLYEMVREALGEQVHMQQQISDFEAIIAHRTDSM